MKRLVKRRSTRASIIMRRGGERFWPRSVAFEAREKRSDPTTRVSTLNLFSPPFFFFTGTGTRMKFKRQSVSCFFPFFFFFFVWLSWYEGRWLFDRSRNLRCFRALADFEACCAPPLYFAMAYRSPYDEDTSVTDCHVPSTLSLSLSDNIEILRRILLIISITFPLRI